jgi:hypothetical protein
MADLRMMTRQRGMQPRAYMTKAERQMRLS